MTDSAEENTVGNKLASRQLFRGETQYEGKKYEMMVKTATGRDKNRERARPRKGRNGQERSGLLKDVLSKHLCLFYPGLISSRDLLLESRK